MSWKKHFQTIPQDKKMKSYWNKINTQSSGSGASNSKFSSYLPEVYAGSPNRIERYDQYNQMDQDSEVNASLDTIADFSTFIPENEQSIFNIQYHDDNITEEEVDIINTMLKQWSKINLFNKRIWRIFRSTIKYGDQFFIRDPETMKLMWIDQSSIDKVIVDEANGKQVQQYVISDLDLNTQNLVASNMQVQNQSSHYPNNLNSSSFGGMMNSTSGGQQHYGGTHGANSTSRWNQPQNSVAVDAKHIVHFSLSEGMDSNWPFGNSILESIYRVFKQKELLEDSVIIYRVQRAPERRVFYIDTGKLPPHKAHSHIERIKNEIHQRRIPNRTGGGSCFTLDTVISLIDKRNLTLSELIKEHNDGVVNWVYSCDPETGKTFPGPISWAGVTRQNTKVIKLTLDNKNTLIVTPDHKIPVWNKGKTEAQNIIINKDKLYSYDDKSYHTIIDIDWDISNKDTGTITVDANEKVHDFHNFLTLSGIYIYNSIMDASYNPMSILEDYYFPQSCLPLKTQINLLDGRKITLNDVINEYNSGIENWIYSLNLKTNEIEKGKIKWAGITRQNADIVRVWLTNNDYVDATPDHRFILDSNDECEAKDLQPDDTLKSLTNDFKDLTNKRVLSVESLPYKEDTCDITVESESNSHVFAVDSGVYVHNSDGRGSKVETLPGGECFALDTKIKLLDGRSLTLNKMIDEFKNGIQNWVYSCNPKTGEIVPGPVTWAGITRQNTQVVKLTFDNNTSVVCTPDHKFPILNRGFVQAKDLQINESMIPLNERSNTYHEIWDNKLNSWIQTHKMVYNYLLNTDLIKKYTKNENNINYHVNNDIFNNDPENIIWNNFNTLEDIVDNSTTKYIDDEYNKLNHKLVNIEWLDEKIDTGTITVDGLELLHDYHTFALDCGIFTKNSLGSIDDMVYFDNKMKRGLRVPSSYLPTGPDDGTANYNDGRVGTAYIQEFRFGVYCKRLQNMINETLDHEFKMFMISRGVQIDSSIFNLQLHEPQNFSKYRQIELDSAQIQVFQPLSDLPYMSKRFLLSRFLNLSESEILKNERMWMEENSETVKNTTGNQQSSDNNNGGLGDVGIRSDGDDEFDDDFNEEFGDEDEELGGENSPISGNDNADDDINTDDNNTENEET